MAISANGEYIVVVGRAGFCVFLIRKRKWKLFGSELQEQSLICRGGVTWYQDVVIFPCRVNEKNEEVSNGWMDGCVYIYICVYIYMYIYIVLCMYMYVCNYVFMYIYVCMHVCICMLHSFRMLISI